MSIDEAIQFCKDKSENIKLRTEPQTFIYIAEWLEELKAMRNLDKTNFSDGYEKGRNDAIDEFVDSLTCQACFTNMQKDAIRIYAEQMKEGAE